MKKERFLCRRCQQDFVLEVLEPGEAEKRRIRTRPICCPKCGGNVERVK